MVTRTLDPKKLPRLCVGERCKRFHVKTWGRAGVGHTEFSRERRQVFPMQSWSSGGVGQCLRSARLLGASGIFSFLEMEFIRSWAKKNPSGADDDTVICSTFSFRTTCCLFRIIYT